QTLEFGKIHGDRSTTRRLLARQRKFGDEIGVPASIFEMVFPLFLRSRLDLCLRNQIDPLGFKMALKSRIESHHLSDVLSKAFANLGQRPLFFGGARLVLESQNRLGSGTEFNFPLRFLEGDGQLSGAM